MTKIANLMDGLPKPPVKGVYFDNNATTPVAPEVVATMIPLLTEHFGNPSSMHRFGTRAADEIATARERVMTFLGAKQASEVVFTGSGSEADSLAIMGTLRALPLKKHLVTTEVEHPAVLGLMQDLKKRHGYELTTLSVDHAGHLDMAELRSALRDDTAIVSIMSANNETGVLLDIEAAGQIAHDRGVVFHVDGVQAAGKLPLDLASSPVDLFSMSGHKLHASKGVGALYVRRGTKLRPLIVGGHQERGRRAGTENVAAIAGFGVACEIASSQLGKTAPQMAELRDRLERGILSAIPASQVNGDRARRLANTTNISFANTEGEGVLLLLDRVGVAVSSGSACTSGSLEPSHVLRAMGLPGTAMRGSIRLSLSRYNTAAEVDYVLQVLPPIIARLREITPFNQEYASS